jgi:hypothetical protein
MRIDTLREHAFAPWMRGSPLAGDTPPSPLVSAKSRKQKAGTNDILQIFEFKDFTGKIQNLKLLALSFQILDSRHGISGIRLGQFAGSTE